MNIQPEGKNSILFPCVSSSVRVVKMTDWHKPHKELMASPSYFNKRNEGAEFRRGQYRTLGRPLEEGDLQGAGEK
jgi:hypothetical protein